MSNVNEIIKDLENEDETIRRFVAEDLGYTHSEEAIIPLIYSLGDKSRSVAEAAADSLSMIGTEAVAKSLLPLLSTENTSIRNHVSEILSTLGEQAVPTLLIALENEDQSVRQFAIDSLGKVQSTQSIPALLKSLEDSDVNVAAVAAELIGHFQQESVIPNLVSHLEDDSWLAGACLRALGEIGTEEAFQAVVNYKNADDPLLVLSVIRALGIAMKPEGVPYLLEIVGQSSMYTEEVIRSIQMIIQKHPHLDWKKELASLSLDDLYQVIEQSNEELRLMAVQLLATLQIESSVPYLVRLFADDNRQIGKAALKAITAIAPLNIQPVLEILDHAEATMIEKGNSLDLLGRLQKEEGKPYLMRYLNSDDLTLQRIAIDALFLPISEKMEQNLLQKLDASSSLIRMHTLLAIGRLELLSMIDQVILLLSDPEEEVSQTADVIFSDLASIQQKQGKIHPFVNFFDKDERKLAFEFFSAQNHTEILPQLKRGLQDSNWNIRKIAIKALVNTVPQQAPALLLPCFKDEREDVIVVAIHAYANLGTSACKEHLQQMLGENQSQRLLYETILALGKIGDEETIPLLLPFLENKEDVYIKLSLIEALGNIGGATALKVLKEIYETEENPEVLELLEQTLASFIE